MESDDLPARPPAGTSLGRLEDIPDREGKEFIFGGPFGFRMFVVRSGGRAYGYVNRCPHVSLTLNLLPDRFVSLGGEAVVCSNHGAAFRFEDGLTVHGPCVGKSLEAVPLDLEDGTLVIGRR